MLLRSLKTKRYKIAEQTPRKEEEKKNACLFIFNSFKAYKIDMPKQKNS